MYILHWEKESWEMEQLEDLSKKMKTNSCHMDTHYITPWTDLEVRWHIVHLSSTLSNEQISTRCITESARPRRATSTILRIVCGNFLKPVGGKRWKNSFIGLEFSTSILIGCNYVNNAAALTRCLILWKSLCACRLPYPKAIKNNFSSLPIYMFRAINPRSLKVNVP